jgi:hypothetical protein
MMLGTRISCQRSLQRQEKKFGYEVVVRNDAKVEQGAGSDARNDELMLSPALAAAKLPSVP